jgi:hypothetical protein
MGAELQIRDSAVSPWLPAVVCVALALPLLIVKMLGESSIETGRN